jgi:hypothetical protein
MKFIKIIYYEISDYSYNNMFVCDNCNLKYATINNNKCVFCNIITENKKSDIYNFIICKSNLNEIDIINKTYDFFNKNDKIPEPKDIDINAKLIKVNPYLFKKNIISDLFKKNIISNEYKIFFTNCIDRNLIKTKRFPQKYSIEKININKFCNGIELEKFDIKTYNKLALKLEL